MTVSAVSLFYRVLYTTIWPTLNKDCIVFFSSFSFCIQMWRNAFRNIAQMETFWRHEPRPATRLDYEPFSIWQLRRRRRQQQGQSRNNNNLFVIAITFKILGLSQEKRVWAVCFLFLFLDVRRHVSMMRYLVKNLVNADSILPKDPRHKILLRFLFILHSSCHHFVLLKRKKIFFSLFYLLLKERGQMLSTFDLLNLLKIALTVCGNKKC